ncbi:hypothetical protein CCY01nite_48390 [Chitinophaga cymbidii]|uniref:Uncharacterized protein n=1 Tax=Chitinophaga cymbidii TaxID=1096750 RepID=A0A512RSB5_9BACT|nr:hypothetical protein CCY01nite_48390 [Chitinophaga cymbidii]
MRSVEVVEIDSNELRIYGEIPSILPKIIVRHLAEYGELEIEDKHAKALHQMLPDDFGKEVIGFPTTG